MPSNELMMLRNIDTTVQLGIASVVLLGTYFDDVSLTDSLGHPDMLLNKLTVCSVSYEMMIKVIHIPSPVYTIITILPNNYNRNADYAPRHTWLIQSRPHTLLSRQVRNSGLTIITVSQQLLLLY